MRQEVREDHRTNAAGNPTGGFSMGVGFDIRWQDGPLGRGDTRENPNGAFVEGVIQAAIGRLEFYERAANGRFGCAENKTAIRYLKCAMEALDERTASRERRGVEGTHHA